MNVKIHESEDRLFSMIEFQSVCPLLRCMEEGQHFHPVCPTCQAVEFCNPFCSSCTAYHHGNPAGLGVQAQQIDWEDGGEKE